MGLFNAILSGFGLEDESVVQRTAIKPRKKPEVKASKYETFNLHNKTSNKQANNLNKINMATSSNLAIFAPKTYEDIQKIILGLKRDQACIVNLQNINEEDSVRALDFFSGAVFALGGQINRIQGDLFLVTPQTVNIRVN
jgi:cell division inhibitor SepF